MVNDRSSIIDMARKKPGPKPMKKRDRRSRHVLIRLRDDEHSALARASDMDDVSLSDYCREIIRFNLSAKGILLRRESE